MQRVWQCLFVAGFALACSSTRSAAPAGSANRVPVANTTVATPADSLYATVQQRLVARGYRIDRADPRARRLVVRPPGEATAVEVRITPKGNSSGVDVVPLDAADMVASMRALITVTHDATRDPTESAPPR